MSLKDMFGSCLIFFLFSSKNASLVATVATEAALKLWQRLEHQVYQHQKMVTAKRIMGHAAATDKSAFLMVFDDSSGLKTRQYCCNSTQWNIWVLPLWAIMLLGLCCILVLLLSCLWCCAKVQLKKEDKLRGYQIDKHLAIDYIYILIPTKREQIYLNYDPQLIRNVEEQQKESTHREPVLKPKRKKTSLSDDEDVAKLALAMDDIPDKAPVQHLPRRKFAELKVARVSNQE